MTDPGTDMAGEKPQKHFKLENKHEIGRLLQNLGDDASIAFVEMDRIQERQNAVKSTSWLAREIDIVGDTFVDPVIQVGLEDWRQHQWLFKAISNIARRIRNMIMIMYNLNLARRDPEEKQESWEVEFSYDGEADLHSLTQACDKNPGHLKFVRVDQFNVDHLPPGYHDNDLIDLVRAMSDLTVRLTVKYISERRYETFSGSSKPYLDYSKKYMTRVASGWVDSVEKYEKGLYKNKTCKCKECLNSPTPKTQFGYINILTVAHVVYDDLEGAHTTCHLFFDRGGTPDLCDGVVTLSGMSHVWNYIDDNRCKMTHVTHDLDLIDRLNKMVDHWHYVKDKYLLPASEKPKSPPPTKPTPDDTHPLAIIVSHPHGRSKHVSVGHCTNLDKQKASDFQYIYTTPTCPGSGGAHVCVIGGHQLDLFDIPVHVGKCKGDKELNHSSGRPDNILVCTLLSSGIKLRKDPMKISRLTAKMDITDIQVRKDAVKSSSWLAAEIDKAESLQPEESCEGETDFHQQLDPCVKNPDHLKSIPIDQFIVGHFPLCYIDNDLVDLVRAMSDLTVCVSVKYVSERRPETYPGSYVPYPCYNDRGSNTTRVGTGRVTLVYKYPEEYDLEDEGNATCQCKECLSSPTPKTEFAHIRIETAAHIVYDKQEAAQTTCHLFFDSGDKPDDCPTAVALSGMLHVFSNTLIDRCEMKYVTHDQELIKKLDKKVDLWNMLADRAEEKYLDPISEKHKSPSSLEHIPDAMHTLTIIVSHPGGGSKQVSIGHYTNIEEDEGDWNQRTYATDTCPGANGAPVFVLGRRRWCDWFYSHVHSENCVANKEINVTSDK